MEIHKNPPVTVRRLGLGRLVNGVPSALTLFRNSSQQPSRCLAGVIPTQGPPLARSFPFCLAKDLALPPLLGKGPDEFAS